MSSEPNLYLQNKSIVEGEKLQPVFEFCYLSDKQSRQEVHKIKILFFREEICVWRALFIVERCP